ncbi:MAG: hypothetical protein K6F89_00355 [Prevotella sp.]|nr:hypothetical protein [Prevotella sp.]
MAHSKELKNLGERFPNKNIGIGNADAKILVVTQKANNEKKDLKYLQKLFQYHLYDYDKKLEVLDICYYVVYDEELLKEPFFNHFQVIIYSMIDGNQLMHLDPTQLFGMRYVYGCDVQSGPIQRLFVAHSEAEGDKPERIMFITYPFEKVSKVILNYEMTLLNLLSWIHKF